MIDKNEVICLFCGAYIKVDPPEGIAIIELKLEDQHNIKTSLEGNMYLCATCYESMHTNLEYIATHYVTAS
jgi:hypothetical protein